eukprot:SAG31_NODE_48_length_30945_cov_16.254263_15_plen_65_part_00
MVFQHLHSSDQGEDVFKYHCDVLLSRLLADAPVSIAFDSFDNFSAPVEKRRLALTVVHVRRKVH